MNFPTELIYVLVFAAFALVQYLLKRSRPQEQQDDAAHGETLEEPYDDVKDPAASLPAIVNVERFDRAEVVSAPIARVRSRFDMASMLATKRDMRNAIVLATILGPCRAYEPHDVR